MKTQILQHCTTCAAHHVAMGKLHKAAAEDCTDEAALEFHRSAADVHADQAEHYLAMYKALDESAEVDTHDDSEGTNLAAAARAFGMTAARDFKAIRPDHVHGVLPTAPTLVSRTGGAPVNKEEVPAEFQHLIETE